MKHPLMENNVTSEQLKKLSDYLLTNPRLTSAGKVKEFESKWSEWLGVKYSVMVNSGSSANFATMLALKNKTNKRKVILSPLTWVSDVNSVIWAGFEPLFLDITLNTLSIDTEILLKENIDDVACVFITHVLGLDGLSDKMLAFLKENQIPLIEDCCESHGALHGTQKLGSIGLASNFSFYYAHHMTTIEGGMISTNDFDFYNLCKMIRSHGMLRESIDVDFEKKYLKEGFTSHREFTFPFAGFNFRPTELNAFLGIEQLKDLDKNNTRRNENFNYFLDNLPSRIYRDYKRAGMSNYALLVLTDEDPDYFKNICKSLDNCEIEYRRGMSGGGSQIRQPYLKNYLKVRPEKYPNVERVHFYGLYIGNYPGLNQEKIDYVLKALKI